MTAFKSWRDIKAYAEEHGFERMATRLQINNDCWNSSGEFGRRQTRICDAMRFAETEEQRLEIAADIERELEEDFVVNAYMGGRESSADNDEEPKKGAEN